MKRQRCGWLIGALLGFGHGASAAAAELEVVVEGLELKGRLMLAVVGGDDAWEGKAKSLVSLDAKVTAAKMVLRLPVPEGRMAVRIFHDENENGKLDTNLLGVPTEGYGFSNNPGWQGPASFEAAAFVVGRDGGRTSIEIR